MLKKFEDNARAAVDRDLKAHQEDPGHEANKVKYYRSRERYMLISTMTGIDSPAKVTARKTLQDAQTSRQQQIVVVALQDLETATSPTMVATALQVAGAAAEVALVLKR